VIFQYYWQLPEELVQCLIQFFQRKRVFGGDGFYKQRKNQLDGVEQSDILHLLKELIEKFPETYLIGVVAVQPGEHRILEHDDRGALL